MNLRVFKSSTLGFNRPKSDMRGLAKPSVALRHGFTLMEMLVVVAIIAILTAVAIPAVVSMKGAKTLSAAADSISSTMEQARSYAMANNTYVYVGFFETSANPANTSRPLTAGVGRVYVQVSTSIDASNGYTAGTWNAANLSALTPLRSFDNVHLVNDRATIQKALPKMDQNAASDQDLSSIAVTTFNGPLGTGNTLCTFTQVIQFSPTGGASIITSLTGTQVACPYIQFGLEPTHGDQIAATVTNYAGFQIDGITGLVQIFRS